MSKAFDFKTVGQSPVPHLVALVPGLVAGTPVLTLAGAMPVEYLMPGDRVITRDGARILRGVHVQVCHDKAMICVSASALGVEQPEEDMLITPDQPVLIRDWRARALKGTDQAMIPAARLVDGDYIRTVRVTEQRLFVLEFDAAVVIYAGGLALACAPVSVPA